MGSFFSKKAEVQTTTAPKAMPTPTITALFNKMAAQKLENSMLLMNMEDSTTDDFDLQYMAFENTQGKSMSYQQLFAQQMNPSFIDEDALTDLYLKFANNMDSLWYKKSAKTKRDELWNKIQADQRSAQWPKPTGVFTTDMEEIFRQPGDVMPVLDESLFKRNNRKKFIHAVGGHGKVRFVSNGNHPYTGIFHGADQGIVRFSTAVKPGKDDNLAPGMGLKFLRDGKDSANLVAMYSVNGQPEWNFFEHDWATFVPASTGLKLDMMGCKFRTATKHIRTVGLSNFGEISATGEKV